MENTQELPLTAAQRNVLAHLRERRAQGHAPATLDQLCEELGLSSRGSLHKQVSALVDLGLVEPMDGKQRGVRLAAASPQTSVESFELPLLGQIAAGLPISAIAGEDRIAVPPNLMPKRDGFALRVRGESMRGIGILDGDTVIVESRHEARNGEVVVALVDEESATLKRFYRRGANIELAAENEEFPPIFYAAERVRVQGVVVGLLRSYR